MESNLIMEKSIFKMFSGSHIELDEFGQNILDCRNEVLFLWDGKAGSLLTQGLRSDRHQELRPTEQPEFEVRYIAVNESGTRLALWSTSGVAIMDLPQRFGPRLEFENGKPTVIVKLRSLDGLDLDFGTSVLQVRWDSSSVFDSALVILLSNNTLYHFVLLPHDTSPIRASRVGCRPVSRLRTLAALGETAIDFCFAPATYDFSDSKETAIFLLRGNGDVCLTVSDAQSDEFPEGEPLPISPLPDDNYLNDACAILALPGQPLCVIIATSRGVVYHTLLVPLDTDQIGVPLRHRKHRLLVVESVLLDPGLHSSSEDFCSYFIRLIADPGHSRRYLAVHGAGVQSVVLEVLSGVQKFIEKDSDRSAANESFSSLTISSLMDSASFKMPESFVEYLICSGRPLLGYTVFPYTFVALDAENQAIVLPLRRIEVVPLKLYTPKKGDRPDADGALTQEMRKPFEQQVEQLLSDSRVLPRLRLPLQDIPPHQLLPLFVRMGNLVRKMTIPRYRQILSILTQRVQIVRSMKQLQMQEVDSLEEDRASILLAAETFADRVQSVVEDIEEQRERLQKLGHSASLVKSFPSDAELRMDLTISEIEAKLNGYSETLEKLKKGRAYQDMKIQQHFETRQVALDNKQATIIRECLSTMGENISGLVTKLNDLNQLLGLSAD